MNFIKVNNTDLIKYPYTWADLREENPYSRYDDRFSLSEWHAQTEEAAATGNTVVEVVVADQPEYDASTHYLTQETVPELINGVWVMDWIIVERPLSTEDASTTSFVSSTSSI